MKRKTFRLKKRESSIDPALLSSELTAVEIFGDSLIKLPSELSALVKLQSLQIISRELESVDQALFELPALTQLKIKYGKFKQLSFGATTSPLKTLFCTDSSLEQLGEDIHNSPELEILVLNSNQLSSLPKNLTCLKNLRRLIISHNKIEDFSFNRADFPRLNHLSLEGNPFNAQSRAHLKKEFNLEVK